MIKFNRLYLKVFLLFWSITLVFLVSITIITGHISLPGYITYREAVLVNQYANLAMSLYKSNNKSALLSWMEHLQHQRRTSLYFVSDKGLILSSAPITKIVNDFSKHYLSGLEPSKAEKLDGILISYNIKDKQNTAYRLLIIPDRKLFSFPDLTPSYPRLRLISILLLSALACYLISIYFMHPILRIKQAVDAFAQGNLKARTDVKITKRYDEMSVLAQGFDKMAEQIEALLLAKERLLQHISHELRSPLARLHIALELARDKTGELAIEELQRIEKEANHLEALIGEILDFAKVSSPERPLNLSQVDLNSILQTLISNARYQYPNARINSTSTSVSLLADATLLHRALDNILKNALLYGGDDKYIQIETHIYNNEVYVSIADNGLGVSEAELPNLIKAFYRGSSSEISHEEGYGLGLSMVYEIVARHAGTVSIKNNPTGGLCVAVTIPLNRV